MLLDARTESLLVTLPSLTKLVLNFRENRPHLDFLSALPQLKVLWLLRQWHVEDVNEEDEADAESGSGAFHVPRAAAISR